MSCLYVAPVVSPVTIFLVSRPAAFLWACLACVPQWHVKTTRVTHVPIVVIFPVCSLVVAPPASISLMPSCLWYYITLLIGGCWWLACMGQFVPVPTSSAPCVPASPSSFPPPLSLVWLLLLAILLWWWSRHGDCRRWWYVCGGWCGGSIPASWDIRWDVRWWRSWCWRCRRYGRIRSLIRGNLCLGKCLN